MDTPKETTPSALQLIDRLMRCPDTNIPDNLRTLAVQWYQDNYDGELPPIQWLKGY